MIDQVPDQEGKEKAPYRVLAMVRGDTLSKVRDISEDEVPVWPDLLRIEFLMALTVMTALLLAALFYNAPLEAVANPTLTPNPAKAPWYFAGLQELLAYFDPWIAGVMIPSIILMGLMAIPFLDPNREGTGEYTFKKRKYTVTVFTIGIALWFLLIIIGVVFRGPNWAWFWPWETWTTDRVSSGVSTNFPNWLGVTAMAVYFGAGLALPYLFAKKIYNALGPIRYITTFGLLLLMFGVPIKMFLRLFFNVKYILSTPWFNI